MNYRKVFLAVTMLAGLIAGCSSDTPDEYWKNEEPGILLTPPDSGQEEEEVPETPAAVRHKTFAGKAMCGYQGWFTAEGDAVGKGWQHLYPNGYNQFKPGYSSIEFWPDMSEYTKKYPTAFKQPDGETAYFFSSADYETTDLHFKWMKQYGIHGAIVQRFKSTILGRPWMEEVLANTIRAAEKYDIAIMLEYDLSGLEEGESLDYIINDWKRLNDRFHFTDPTKCPNYLWEKGRPLVGFFGISLNNGKSSTPEQYLELMNSMEGRDGVKGELSYLAGSGYAWLSSGSDAKPFSQWEKVFKRCAVIAPWAVGRYSDVNSFINKKEIIERDIAWCKKNNKVYAPVAFPGFSWRNTQTVFEDNGTKITLPARDVYDQVPRLKGTFFWRQLASYVEWGADALFLAMFDEIDEGTAIFKCTHRDMTPINTSEVNPNGEFLSYDDDLNTGYYIFLAGEAGKWLRGATGYTQTRPAYKEPAAID